ncbi:MAG TPA: hypothetical protein VG123_29430 [Streptosporangiaceae bacterium]|jgi:hypothetical protein|nr:hypothetical protein [Streptosporangiaceae bacterium]
MAERRPRDPAQRLDQAVLAQGIEDRYWPDADLAQFAGHQNLTWWIAHLREAGTSVRRFRNRLEALRDGDPPRRCPGCGAPVTGRADAIYCGTSCRVRAHRTRT